MRIPYVIDNQTYQLADILNYLLQDTGVQAMDIATAYFSVRGYQQVAQGLDKVSSFRLLLGADLETGDEVGMRPADTRIKGLIQRDLNLEAFSQDTLKLVEDLIAFLQRDDVEVKLYHGEGQRRRFLHAKCYLMYGGRKGQMAIDPRFNPLVGIVGSSNFTGPGLTTNQELNTVHKTLLERDEVDDDEARAEVAYQADVRGNDSISLDNRRLIKSEAGARAIMDLRSWYEVQWQQSEDFKEDLIELLWESKFGEFEYTPYQIYIKALFEYFKDDVRDEFDGDGKRTAIELTDFQEDAVRKARQILRKYDGVMIADSVGLGKTWIGKRLLEDYAYHMRQKALVICPASLRIMWQDELRSATIAGDVISQEELGRDEFDLSSYTDVDVILIDEAHNFRNRNANRYEKLETLINANARRGRDGTRKKVILLTATPINNNVFDLYNQIMLFTGNDQSYFASAGIADLRRYFLAARRASNDHEASVELFNLLEEVVVRRTRPFIRNAYENATIGGKKISWPQRRLKTAEYDFEEIYEGIYQQIVERIEGLNLAQYSLEDYKIDRTNIDDFELGREQALVGIFKSRFLKRFESSVESFRISIRRALEFTQTFRQELIHHGRLLKSEDFRKAQRLIETEDESTNDTPRSQSRQFEKSNAARDYLAGLETLNQDEYDLEAIDEALEDDISALSFIWYKIEEITPDKDAKLQCLKDLLAGELRDKKLLIFTYYRDTAMYLKRHLAGRAGAAFRESIGNPNIHVVHGGDPTKTRARVVDAFSPYSHDREDLIGTDAEIDILISTDALSEGQNLQDAGFLLNYDLHWNPTRMVQRAGRIDRLGSRFENLWIYNMFPDQGLERLLGLVESLNTKIETINTAGFLDASVLGEIVNPRNFNTLRRIREEDNTVIEEEETLVELASSEALMRELQQFISTEDARRQVEELPDGIHSGLYRDRAQGVFFYFATQKGEDKQHFWRYYDLQTREIHDNRYIIADLIKCLPDTPRYVPADGDVDIFDIQERVIIDIVQATEEQVAVEAAPKQTDPILKTIVTALRDLVRNPSLDRRVVLEMMKFIDQPMPNVHIKTLREAYGKYTSSGSPSELIETIATIQEQMGQVETSNSVTERTDLIKREDLYLVCFEYIWN